MTKGKHYETAPEDRIPLFQKAAYGAGMLANQLFTAALSIFMVVLVNGINMNPFWAGVLGFAPRIFDAITDPFMGYISDHTHSKWGRRRPYIFIGAIITGIAFIFMWQIEGGHSQVYNFFYFLFWSLVFYLGYTIFATPYVALGYEMSNDFNERTRLMGAAQFIGQFAWVLAPWCWVVIYNPELFASAPDGARYLAFWVGAFCMIIGLIPSLLCKERVIPEDEKKRIDFKDLAGEAKSFLKGFVTTFQNRQFIKICAATFLVFNGFQTVAAFDWYIIVYDLFGGDIGGAGKWPTFFGMISALCTMFLAIPVVTVISKNIGKKGAFIVSTTISMIGYLLKWWCFTPANLWLMFLPLPFFSFGIGGLFTLMMSMTADVCDMDELEHHERREGMFGAVYWWMVKLGNGIALLVSGAVLAVIGFQPGVAEQLASTLTNLRIATIGIPIIGSTIAIAAIWSYDITEEKAHELKAELEARRGEAKLKA